ncbi:probable G-protein coupled receptor 139 [Amblyraja radiata]|uniref:probable G-protein coupled receptor 139 n=1 Tax=Amblyraja radiata TaxID=386614 RepID=UPI0014024366|nr:probable G-protein coupled receptor 139 [Amblyraja radiata]
MAAADLMAVFCNVAIFYLYAAIFRHTHTIACTLHYVMAYVSLDCSVWLTVAFTFDRFVAICCQDFKTRYCTVRIARVAIATVYVVSLIRNIPYYFAFYSYEINQPVGCMEKPEYFSHPGWLAFAWIHNVLTPLLPFFVIVSLNIVTIRSIVVASRARRKLRAHVSGEKQEDPELESRRKSIILLFCVSGSFILLWLTDVITFIYTHIANIHYIPNWAHPLTMAAEAGNMLKILSSCTNTIIYVVTQSKGVVPTCLKTTTIVPKQSASGILNDFGPVALAPIMAKCFERLIPDHLKYSLLPTLSPHQFAYRSNREAVEEPQVSHQLANEQLIHNTITRLNSRARI